MSGVNIYENNTASTYILKYNIDNFENFSISKTTGVIPFSLPIVDQLTETSGRILKESSEFIHIDGVTATLDLRFTIGISDINNILSLVSNRVSKKHKIDVTDWSGLTSGFTFIGIVDTVKINQAGGDMNPTCNLTFLEGANTMDGLDGY